MSFLVLFSAEQQSINRSMMGGSGRDTLVVIGGGGGFSVRKGEQAGKQTDR